MKKMVLGLAVVLLGSSMVQAASNNNRMSMMERTGQMGQASSKADQEALYNQLKPYINRDAFIDALIMQAMQPALRYSTFDASTGMLSTTYGGGRTPIQLYVHECIHKGGMLTISKDGTTFFCTMKKQSKMKHSNQRMR